MTHMLLSCLLPTLCRLCMSLLLGISVLHLLSRTDFPALAAHVAFCGILSVTDCGFILEKDKASLVHFRLILRFYLVLW